MRTTIERDGPTKLRLLVEVEPAELKPHYDRTLRRLADEVKVPGFRRGKVPARVLETRIGKDSIRQEMLREALPDLYDEAARAEQLRAVDVPDIEVTRFEDGEPLTFTATIEVRPEIELPDYHGIEVEGSETEATDDEISTELDRLRDRFATLEPVARTATKADHVLIDLNAYRHSEHIDAASAKDLLYEVGSGGYGEELDSELEGKRTGDILKVNVKLPERFGPELAGQEVSYSVIVKEVHAKRLPALDDSFAATASEFDTLDELKDELRRRIEAFKKMQAEIDVRNRVLDALLDRMEVPVPESMLARATEAQLAGLLSDLRRHGLTLDQYFAATETSREDLVETHKAMAQKTLAADLVLTAIAEAEGLEVSRDEIETEVERMSKRAGRPANEVLAELEESGRVGALADDILRRKALDHLVEHARIVGGE